MCDNRHFFTKHSMILAFLGDKVFVEKCFKNFECHNRGRRLMKILRFHGF